MSGDLVKDPAEDMLACRRALDELVSAIVAHDLTRPRNAAEKIEIVPFKAIMDLERMAFRSLTNDPVRGALKLGVKRVGQQVYRLGGMDALHDAAERVAAMDAAHEGRRISIIDSAFNGVGEGDDRWWS